ncbi:MAG: hypothetical protein ACRC2S_28520 [Waterburya sp.]
MHHPFLVNQKIYLIDCQIKGDRLTYGIGIFMPGVKTAEQLKTEQNKAVNVALSEDEINLQKKAVFLNRSLKVDPAS